MTSSFSTNLTELDSLLRLLRAHGVTKYVSDGLCVELGVAPGAAEPMHPGPEQMRSEVAEAMHRLDPMYSDPALFAIK